MTDRLVVGITGATGIVYAERLLQKLQSMPIETHLIVSPSALLTLQTEGNISKEALYGMATQVHSFKAVGACLASGAFHTRGMIIVPCSMNTLACVAHGISDNLITRAADVHLKERRPVVLAVRETPLNLAHLRNMTAVTEMGGIVFPPVPAFYQRPQSIEDLVEDTVNRLLQMVGLPMPDAKEWLGVGWSPVSEPIASR